MPKPRQVYTPGSQPPKKGRPANKKIVSKTGTRRKGNYRSRYTQEDFHRALTSVKNGEMSVRAASREFDVSNFKLYTTISINTSPIFTDPKSYIYT